MTITRKVDSLAPRRGAPESKPEASARGFAAWLDAELNRALADRALMSELFSEAARDEKEAASSQVRSVASDPGRRR